MKIVNLTPHSINLYLGDVDQVLGEIPPSGIVARVTEEIEEVSSEYIDESLVPVKIYKKVYGNLVGLPAPEAGTYYVTSILAAQAAKEMGRNDILVTNDAVRDPFGAIIGCRSFVSLTPEAFRIQW